MSESSIFGPLSIFILICVIYGFTALVFWNILIAIAKKVWEWIKHFSIDIIWGNLKVFWFWLRDNLIYPVWNAIKAAWNATYNFCKDAINWIITTSKKIWNGFLKLMGKAKDESKKIWEGSKKLTKYLVSIGGEAVSKGISIIQAIWNYIVDKVKSLFKTILSIPGHIADFFRSIGSTISSILDSI